MKCRKFRPTTLITAPTRAASSPRGRRSLEGTPPLVSQTTIATIYLTTQLHIITIIIITIIIIIIVIIIIVIIINTHLEMG